MENRDWQSLFPNYRERKASRPQRAGRTGGTFIWVVGAVLILLILLGFGRGIYTEWLWFSSLGYSSVFTTIIGTRAAVFFIAAAVVCALLLGNLILAKQLVPKVASVSLPVSGLSRLQGGFKGL